MSPLKPHSLTEKTLIQNCLNGEATSQRALFEMYAGKMMTVCRRYGRHQGEAEDIMQEGFIKVFLNLEKFNASGSFEGWVRRIMVNTALKFVSKKSFTNESLGIESYQLNDRNQDPQVFSKLSVDDMMHLVSMLPDGYRFVFNLYAIEGYSHREISELLGIEESTSRSQLVKARRILQQKITELNSLQYEAS